MHVKIENGKTRRRPRGLLPRGRRLISFLFFCRDYVFSRQFLFFTAPILLLPRTRTQFHLAGSSLPQPCGTRPTCRRHSSFSATFALCFTPFSFWRLLPYRFCRVKSFLLSAPVWATRPFYSIFSVAPAGRSFSFYRPSKPSRRPFPKTAQFPCGGFPSAEFPAESFSAARSRSAFLSSAFLERYCIR